MIGCLRYGRGVYRRANASPPPGVSPGRISEQFVYEEGATRPESARRRRSGLRGHLLGGVAVKETPDAGRVLRRARPTEKTASRACQAPTVRALAAELNGVSRSDRVPSLPRSCRRHSPSGLMV